MLFYGATRVTTFQFGTLGSHTDAKTKKYLRLWRHDLAALPYPYWSLLEKQIFFDDATSKIFF